MNLVFFFSLLFPFVVSLIDFNINQTESFLSLLNQERLFRKVPPVTLNENLTLSLQQFISLGGAHWGYENSNISHPAFENYLNFRILASNPTFLSITKNYENLPKLIETNFLDVAHDTFIDRTGTSGRALHIFRMRLRQRRCFDNRKCSTEIFTNYRTCSKFPAIGLTFKRPCQWFNVYYPRMIHKNVTQVAFVKLQRPGRFAPTKVQNNAWLIVFVMSQQPLNDKCY